MKSIDYLQYNIYTITTYKDLLMMPIVELNDILGSFDLDIKDLGKPVIKKENRCASIESVSKLEDFLDTLEYHYYYDYYVKYSEYYNVYYVDIILYENRR